MGIIKKMKQLGEQIHGAKVGYVATFDKDGHVISTDKLASKYLLPAILTTDNGKFLRVKPAGGSAEWAEISQVPAFTQDDDGKVLTATDQGAAWAPVFTDITSEFDFTGANLSKDFFQAYKSGKMIYISYRGSNITESSLTNPVAITIPVAYHVSERQGMYCYSGSAVTLGFVSSTSNAILVYTTVASNASIYINGWFYIQ